MTPAASTTSTSSPPPRTRSGRKPSAIPSIPGKVEVSGLVKKPRTLDLDAVMKGFPLEERLYRFRCVERWSMQVPWTGYPLRSLLDSLDPLPSATHVRFVCVDDPEHLTGAKESPWYPWPYHEGLRLDEARNPLAFVVVGSYGHALPMQHGAPLRLAIPWKYGYKGPKSIVKIEFLKEQPPTFWNVLEPREYGFYSNVNPQKPHPRWSQEIETDIGTGGRRPTLPYNGYGIRWRGCTTARRYDRPGSLAPSPREFCRSPREGRGPPRGGRHSPFWGRHPPFAFCLSPWEGRVRPGGGRTPPAGETFPPAGGMTRFQGGDSPPRTSGRGYDPVLSE
jgi:DMSO/TMAO reductase YedYZ molybdopterin-dependent catalytic subunit